MAIVNCPKCKKGFKPHGSVKTLSGLAAGAATGAYFGSSVGIVAGPLGAANGVWFGAVVGAAVVGLGVRQVAICPNCKKVALI
jgi:hypothetical protein